MSLPGGIRMSGKRAQRARWRNLFLAQIFFWSQSVVKKYYNRYGIFRPLVVILSFHSLQGNGFSHMSGAATNMGKENSSWVTNGTFPLPQEWLSRRDEIKIPHERRSREWGIFILSQLLSHEWGSGNVPWVTNEEFYSSLFLSRPGITFPYGEENFISNHSFILT